MGAAALIQFSPSSVALRTATVLGESIHCSEYWLLSPSRAAAVTSGTDFLGSHWASELQLLPLHKEHDT